MVPCAWLGSAGLSSIQFHKAYESPPSFVPAAPLPYGRSFVPGPPHVQVADVHRGRTRSARRPSGEPLSHPPPRSCRVPQAVKMNSFIVVEAVWLCNGEPFGLQCVVMSYNIGWGVATAGLIMNPAKRVEGTEAFCSCATEIRCWMTALKRWRRSGMSVWTGSTSSSRQLEILAHGNTAVFMSHCSWNSTMESPSHGKPILTRSSVGI
ncbi:putative cis-zeatin O-glucosyltransferase [Aegilops tauschii subsp. strangulata]|uniref:putative cis-zeatin O-glucosyltransferase n=1 Tax=Aegilops tauschii subsp. strangulata TaxID=200361 RepID=UPI003CC8891F